MSTVKKILSQANAWVGLNEKDRSFTKILDIYNNHTPLARGYKIKPNDEWCACTISAIFIAQNCSLGLLGGTEVSCQRFIDIFKTKGIWIEDGTIRPKPGDIVLFDWQSKGQPNLGWADHIGIVESVDDKTFTTIEGNLGQRVAKRTCKIGWQYIRGFARPEYTPEHPSGEVKSLDQIAKEVIAGKWGSGAVRQKSLETAGYDYKEIQRRVNDLLRK